MIEYIMGCLFSKPSNQESPKRNENQGVEAPKQYSWDKRDKIDPKQFTIEDLKGETAGRLPGTINGQQFIIQNCQDSNIYIFDHTATVSVDDCTNCRIFLGPIKTSVFVRDCKDCKFMIACQQFRTRDCQKLDVFLTCVTQPIIEASTGMRFGCHQCNYPELEDQFRQAELSVFNNNWSNIHDFTPVTGENNFTLISEDALNRMEEYIPAPSTEELAAVQFSTKPETSLVPRTLGARHKPTDQSCLVVFFNDGLSHDRAKNFIIQMKTNHTGCVLVQSKQLTMQASDGQRVFATDSYTAALQQGPVIGLEYNGEDVCQACQDTCVTVCQGSTGLVFVSNNPSTATSHIEQFYSFADMQMAV